MISFVLFHMICSHLTDSLGVGLHTYFFLKSMFPYKSHMRIYTKSPPCKIQYVFFWAWAGNNIFSLKTSVYTCFKMFFFPYKSWIIHSKMSSCNIFKLCEILLDLLSLTFMRDCKGCLWYHFFLIFFYHILLQSKWL